MRQSSGRRAKLYADLEYRGGIHREFPLSPRRCQNREMEIPSSADHLRFQAAVERPLSVVFKSTDGQWEGHDYTVEVITERQGLDGFDVVMDFREIEAVMDSILAPFQGKLLSELGLKGPLELAQKLAAELAPHVLAPTRLAEVALTDGRGRRLAVRP